MRAEHRAAGNRTLSSAKKAKQDEFYTQLSDIENELKHYKTHLRGKVVLCNCDDPKESKFVEYFGSNFKALGLKKLIATSYTGSPIQQELPFGVAESRKRYGTDQAEGEAYVMVIDELTDLNHDGAVNWQDVVHKLRNDERASWPLKGDGNYSAGDFRSKECIEFLQRADIVVTNPPFSLFREYIAQLVEYEKHFLIIGNQNAITYKEVFKLIKDNKVWLGMDNGGTKWFQVPDGYDIQTESRKKIVNGIKYFSMGSIMWFTNMHNPKRDETIPLFKKYSPEAYPRYDNYDAIEVSKVADIPEDYDGMMGVPVTFLDKYNPDQFEIIGYEKSYHLQTKKYGAQVQVDKGGKMSSVSKLNDGVAIRVAKPPTSKTHYLVDGETFVQQYKRIFIKRRHS